MSRVPIRQVISWCVFDVANSAYTTLIITVAFNVVFTKLIVGPDTAGSFSYANALWAWVLAASWGAVALMGPYLGFVSDARGLRKAFLAASVLVCCLGSLALYGVGPGDVWLALFLVAVSNIGYSLSENFIAAFLPSVARPDQMGRISGLAWGMGYFGGLAAIVITQRVTGFDYRFENFETLRWVGPLTGIFFLVFSLPALVSLKEPVATRSVERGFSAFKKAFNQLPHSPDLLMLLVSSFFFQGALAIVISFAAIYGEQAVGLAGQWQAAFFISLQLTAAVGAFFFGWLQGKKGALYSLNLTLYVWLLSVAGLFLLRPLGEWLGLSDLRSLFFVLGNLAGFCLGATQSCTRALVGQMAPYPRSGEIFGLWGFFTKLAYVFALVVFGWLQKVVSLRDSLLFCAVLFGVSLFLNRFINEKRATQRACSAASV